VVPPPSKEKKEREDPDRLAIGEGGHGGNTALVVLVTRHPDVSGLSPAGSPRVLDDPIGASRRINTPSNSQDTVVQRGARASGLIVDSRGVELERRLRSIDGNRGGSLLNKTLEGILVSAGNVLEALEGSTRVGSRILAGSVFSSVGVAGFSVNTSIGNDVLHGLSHQTSLTSVISIRSRAVNQVLLRETN
jgi:hypothetical protein